MAAIGIDLGTTNSLIAVYEEDGPRLILNSLGNVLTPSAISLGDDGNVIVGAAAKDRLLSHPSLSVASFKRFMGTQRLTKLGKKEFRPEELSALVLRSLKADAEAFLGTEMNQAVISVPAYFNDQQRKATMAAGQLAGLSVERLVNEPTAAALAYGLSKAEEGHYLVFDLGGGTFDVSILDKYDDIMEIRATTGDTHLGGDDFTNIVESLLANRHQLKPNNLNDYQRAQLLRQAEILKCAITKEQEQSYAFELGNQRIAGKVTRQEFESASTSLLQRLRLPTERAVRDAELSPSSFDAIVLVGGATRMPMVRSLVARMFGRLPLINIDPDTTVGLGAAVQSGLIRRNGALRDVVMTDVCPYTLGVATVDDPEDSSSRLSVSAIIERNAIIPISRSITVSTVSKNQVAIAVKVYQGENLRPENNVHLGTIEAKVPRGPKGKESIDIRFTYDANGALQVEVTVLSTGKVYAEIFNDNSGLSAYDLNMRFHELQSLKLHPRDKMENQTLIARAERLYEESRGDDRDFIKSIVGEFEHQLARQQMRNSEPIRTAFAEQLDAIEASLRRLD